MSVKESGLKSPFVSFPPIPSGEREIDFTQHFPDELLLEIFGRLSASDLRKTATVSSEWRRISDDQVLWARLLEVFQTFSGQEPGTEEKQTLISKKKQYYQKIKADKEIPLREYSNEEAFLRQVYEIESNVDFAPNRKAMTFRSTNGRYDRYFSTLVQPEICKKYKDILSLLTSVSNEHERILIAHFIISVNVIFKRRSDFFSRQNENQYIVEEQRQEFISIRDEAERFYSDILMLTNQDLSKVTSFTSIFDRILQKDDSFIQYFARNYVKLRELYVGDITYSREVDQFSQNINFSVFEQEDGAFRIERYEEAGGIGAKLINSIYQKKTNMINRFREDVPPEIPPPVTITYKRSKEFRKLSLMVFLKIKECLPSQFHGTGNIWDQPL